MIDRYAILMIPSSLVAFQVITAIIAFITLVTFGLTIYLLAFHIYLCKWMAEWRKIEKGILLGKHGISTYDYVVQQRLDQTADQALSQFSQMQQNSQAALPKQSKLPFHRRKSNQINTVADNSSFKQIPNTHVFTVQGNHVRSLFSLPSNLSFSFREILHDVYKYVKAVIKKLMYYAVLLKSTTNKRIRERENRQVH